MTYIPSKISKTIDITALVTIHYFEHAKDYIFDGERHDFWEFMYVDKGRVEVMADTEGYELKQGELIFHKPGEFHSLWANGSIAPNIVVVSFHCTSPAMQALENKIMAVSDDEKHLLSRILTEARKAYTTDLSYIDMVTLDRNPDAPAGCEQLIQLYLEQMLISMIRTQDNIRSEHRLSSTARERSNTTLVNKTLQFLEDHLHENLAYADVLDHTNVSSTHLKVTFKEMTGTTVMEHFRSLKMEQAKILIREGNYNFSQIALQLGYSSIHYFSRQFKSLCGMSPSEYSRTVMSRLD